MLASIVIGTHNKKKPSKVSGVRLEGRLTSNQVVISVDLTHKGPAAASYLHGHGCLFISSFSV